MSIARTLFEAESIPVLATTLEHPLHSCVDAQMHAILTFPNECIAVMDDSFLLDDQQD